MDNPYATYRTDDRPSMTGPPRAVPGLVRLRVMFGGFVNQFGWIFFGFGMIFVWAFNPLEDVAKRMRFRGTLARAEGKIVRVEPTNVSINNQKVYAHHYEFQATDETRRTGVAYDTDDSPGPGQAVTVEYVQADPSASRIPGMSYTAGGLFGLFVLIFPAVGLGFLAFGLRKSLKGLRLLRDGRPAIGRLIATTPTHSRVNNQTVYKFTFEFQAEDGQTYQATARTHETDRFAGEPSPDGAAKAEGVFEPLLYDPMAPRRAVMLDDLPGGPRIDPDGSIRVDSAVKSAGALAIPAIVCIGHGMYLLTRLG